jgi:NTE family protein
MARALLEAGHYPDMLYGTSAGALNAAWLSMDPTVPGLMSLEERWTKARSQDVFPFRPLMALSGLVGLGDHTVSARNLAAWLRTTSPLRRLQDGVLPLGVMATDVETGEGVLLEEGPAVPALLASSAMPGVFPPVRVGERWLMDGSVASDTPVGPAVCSGATRVWVLPSVPTTRAARPRTVLDALLRASSFMVARNNAEILGAWCDRCELYVVPPPLVPGVSPFRFDKSAQLIEAAHSLACSWLRDPKPLEPRSHDVGAAESVPVQAGQREL